MKTIEIPTIASKYDNEVGHYTSEHVLAVNTTVYRGTQLQARMGLGGWTKQAEGRVVHEGPMVKGPYAYTYGLAVCLCSQPEFGTGAESERMKAAGTEHLVEQGDRLILAGTTFSIDIKKSGCDAWITLIKVD